MADLERLLAEGGAGLRWWTPPPTADDVVSHAGTRGWWALDLDLAGVTARSDLWHVARQALRAPGWAGNGFDALADLLGDLGWLGADRWAVVVHGQRELAIEDPEAWRTLLEVLAGAAEWWAAEDRRFLALVQAAGPSAGG